jgi:secernin
VCDVLVALTDATRRGTVVFGRNSDRPVDDCQVVHASPHRARERGRSARCSYVDVPDDDEALATLGCRPYWCWGYESGVNEAGVAGGNSAIYTRVLRETALASEPGLTGMDLLRFALERAATAEGAVGVITDLLERYGQWGSAVPGQSHDSGSYDNAFLLADARESWVLETAGRAWAAERVPAGVRSLSNEPTIRRGWSEASSGLEQHARGRGWVQPPERAFDFALDYGDHEHYSRQGSHIRCARSAALLQAASGAIDERAMMGFLRDHYEGTFLGGPQFHPYLPDFHTICMHVSPAGFTWGNTATSFVVELATGAPPMAWVAFGPPCTGLYTAVPFDAAIPAPLATAGTAGLEVRPAVDAPLDTFHERSLWWRIRRLVDAVAANPERLPAVRELFHPLEEARLRRAEQVHHAGAPERDAFLEAQVAETEEALARIERRFTVRAGTA